MRDGGAEYRLLRSTAELHAMAPQWSALWRSDSHATPFQTPEWLLPWWRQFGCDPRAVAIFQNGSLTGLMHFYILDEPENRTCRLMLAGVGTTDYLDGIFAPSCSPEHVRAGLELLWGEPGWDLFSVTQLRSCSKLLHAAGDARRAPESAVRRCRQ